MATKIKTNQKTVSFIGSVGLPQCYGGFESFLESVAPVIAASGHRVIVTCDRRRYQDLTPVYKGVEREFIAMPANGALSQLHDLLAYLKVFRSSDAVVVLGVSAGFFFLVMRLLASLYGKQLVVNVDGIEWRRTKFSKPVRLILRLFDALAQVSATTLIFDNPELEPFIFPRFRRKARFIAYPGDHVERRPEVHKELKALTICRIEPENNIEMLLQGALDSGIANYTFIGNWENSDYGRGLRAKYSVHSNLSLLDPIYDSAILATYRESHSIYLHGHSVGGTNPSLVEMLFYDGYILCFDCTFNRSTAGKDARYFASATALGQEIRKLQELPVASFRQARSKYTSAAIAEQYAQAALGDEASLYGSLTTGVAANSSRG